MEKNVEPEEIKGYLIRLAMVTKMDGIEGPFTTPTHELEYGDWVHWKTSGCHFCAYHTTPPLFTVDIYAYKSFLVKDAVDLTRKYFKPIEMVWKEIEV